MRDQDGVGSIWTWTAIDADSKLAVSWMVGKRNSDWAMTFMEDVADRLRNRVQLGEEKGTGYFIAEDRHGQSCQVPLRVSHRAIGPRMAPVTTQVGTTKGASQLVQPPLARNTVDDVSSPSRCSETGMWSPSRRS